MAEESAEVPRELAGKSRTRGLPPASALMACAALPTRAGVPQVPRPGSDCGWAGSRSVGKFAPV